MNQTIFNRNCDLIKAEGRIDGLHLVGSKLVYQKANKNQYKRVLVGEKVLSWERYRKMIEPIVRDKATVIVYDNMVKVKMTAQQPPQLENVRRGTVNLDFSGKKRKRFTDDINSWRMGEGENMFMLTLTYPDIFPLDWHIWKENLEQFRSLLLSEFPDCEGFWRLELIDRKSGQSKGRLSPHFHLILKMFKNVTKSKFKKMVGKWWAKIAHSQDKFQGKYATRVDKILTPRHALNYAAKYCTKWSGVPLDANGEPIDASHINCTIGRQWGKIGKPDLSHSGLYVISRNAAKRLYQAFLEIKIESGDSWKGFWKQSSSTSFTSYNTGDNPKTHERYHRPALPPANSIISRILEPYGKPRSYRILSIID